MTIIGNYITKKKNSNNKYVRKPITGRGAGRIVERVQRRQTQTFSACSEHESRYEKQTARTMKEEYRRRQFARREVRQEVGVAVSVWRLVVLEGD